MLRRAKEILASRAIDAMPQEQRDYLDQRYPWNKEQRPAKTLLDYFTSLKYSYSSLLPFVHRAGNVDLVVSEKGKLAFPTSHAPIPSGLTLLTLLKNSTNTACG